MKVPFWKLLVAYFIDWLVVTLLGGIIGAIMGFVLGMFFAASGADMTTVSALFVPIFAIIGIGWFALYFAVMEYKWHASLGKMAMGIVVMPKQP